MPEGYKKALEKMAANSFAGIFLLCKVTGLPNPQEIIEAANSGIEFGQKMAQKGFENTLLKVCTTEQLTRLANESFKQDCERNQFAQDARAIEAKKNPMCAGGAGWVRPLEKTV